MDITFECGHCNQSMVIDSAGSGSLIQCPKCGSNCKVPELTPRVQQPASTFLSTTTPAWVVAVTAFLYGTGFLVILTFHSSYNLHGIDDAIFKLRYTHVGLIFVTVPIAVGIAAYTLFNYLSYLWSSVKDVANGWWKRMWTCVGLFFVGHLPPPADEPPHPFAISGILLVIANLYTFLTIAPPHSYPEAKAYLWGSLILFIAGRFVLQLIRRLLKDVYVAKSVGRSCLITLRVISRDGIQIVQLWCLYHLVMLRASDCDEILTHGTFYFGLSLFLGYQVYSMRKRVIDIKNNEHTTRMWQVLGVCVLGLIYYFTVAFYGLSAFHYIPAIKGGGDFTFSPLVRLVLKDDDITQYNNWLINTNNPNGELVLIEATSTSLYVANPTENGGPPKWRQARANRPRVQEIPRSSVVAIEHLQRTWEEWWKSNTVTRIKSATP